MESLKALEKQLETRAGNDREFDFIRIETPRTRLEKVVIDPSILNNLKNFVSNYNAVRECRQRFKISETIDYGLGTILLLHGPPGTGKTMTARAVAHYTSRPLVTFLTRTERYSRSNFAEHLPVFLKTIETENGIGLIDECHQLFEEDDYELSVFLTEIEKSDVLVILSTTEPQSLGTALDRRISYKIAYTQPDATQRLKIWNNLLPPSVSCSDDVDLEKLARHFNINGGYIKNAILHALTLAIHRNSDRICLTMADLVRACSLQEQCTGIHTSIRNVLQPAYTLDSICLSETDRRNADRIARRLQATFSCETTHSDPVRIISRTYNILVGCADESRGEAVALALAGAIGTLICRINVNMVFDNRFNPTRKDEMTLLRQTLDAAYESNQTMVIEGYGDPDSLSDESADGYETQAIRSICAHPGRKIFLLKRLNAFLRRHADYVLDTIEIGSPGSIPLEKAWRCAVAPYGVELPDNFIRKATGHDLSETAIQLILNRAEWIASTRQGGAITQDDLCEALDFVAGMQPNEKPLFGPDR